MYALFGTSKTDQDKTSRNLEKLCHVGASLNSPAKNIVANNMSSECESSYNLKLLMALKGAYYKLQC